MLKILLNRLKPQAEKIIAEDQAGFRPGRSTTYLQPQDTVREVPPTPARPLPSLRVWVWQATLWTTMRQYNINANLIRMTHNLYDKATSEKGYIPIQVPLAHYDRVRIRISSMQIE